MRALKAAWFHTWIKDLRLFQRQSKASAAGDMSMDEAEPGDVLNGRCQYQRIELPVHAYQFDVLYDPQVLQLDTTPVDLSNTLSRGLTAVMHAPGSSSSLAFSGLMLNEANPAADGKSGKVVLRRWCDNNSSWTSLTHRGSA